MNKAPLFAVVGHPNKGKSSLVATLAQDDSVHIAAQSGTTVTNQSFPLKLDQKTLYTLIDTPGFQRAREVLEWLKDHSNSVSDRTNTIARFIETFQNDERFYAETQLLKPVIEGAGIIYVVDGSRPYGPEYEIEMEILRWTGQPSMALINLIGKGDYVDSWRKVLNQYFKIVRVFNPLSANFDERISLLRGFSHLDENWSTPLEMAINALISQRHHLRHQSAQIISSLLESVLSHRESSQLGIEPDTRTKALEQKELEQRFESAISMFEESAQDKIKTLYQHHYFATIDEPEKPLLESDLFSTETWKIFGLDQHQLLTTSITGGAIAGGVLDLAVAGYSFFLGAGLGAAGAGIATWFASHQLAKISILGNTLGGVELSLGPVKNRNFPYVLLSRALLHQHLTETHSHADRSNTLPDNFEKILNQLELKDRLPFEKLFAKFRKGAGLKEQQRQELHTLILEILER